MFAIIKTGGKQFRVQNGDVIFVEKLNAAEGETVNFDVLMLENDGEAQRWWDHFFLLSVQPQKPRATSAAVTVWAISPSPLSPFVLALSHTS